MPVFGDQASVYKSSVSGRFTLAAFISAFTTVFGIFFSKPVGDFFTYIFQFISSRVPGKKDPKAGKDSTVAKVITIIVTFFATFFVALLCLWTLNFLIGYR